MASLGADREHKDDDSKKKKKNLKYLIRRWSSFDDRNAYVSFINVLDYLSLFALPLIHFHHHHHHQSLNREGRWGTNRWFCNQFSPFFPVLHCPLGLAELQACPFPDVVFPPLPLSALSSSPFHCALQDGFGQTWWTGNMTILLQFASFYDRQEIFMWSYCLLDLGTDFLVGNMVFVWDV